MKLADTQRSSFETLLERRAAFRGFTCDTLIDFMRAQTASTDMSGWLERQSILVIAFGNGKAYMQLAHSVAVPTSRVDENRALRTCMQMFGEPAEKIDRLTLIHLRLLMHIKMEKK